MKFINAVLKQCNCNVIKLIYLTQLDGEGNSASEEDGEGGG